MMAYLLGFPTPVVETVVILAGTVVALALYFGLRFESVETIDPAPKSDADRPPEDGSDRRRGEDVETEVTG